jgi:hypothetical protein
MTGIDMKKVSFKKSVGMQNPETAYRGASYNQKIVLPAKVFLSIVRLQSAPISTRNYSSSSLL